VVNNHRTPTETADSILRKASFRTALKTITTQSQDADQHGAQRCHIAHAPSAHPYTTVTTTAENPKAHKHE